MARASLEAEARLIRTGGQVDQGLPGQGLLLPPPCSVGTSVRYLVFWSLYSVPTCLYDKVLLRTTDTEPAKLFDCAV